MGPLFKLIENLETPIYIMGVDVGDSVHLPTYNLIKKTNKTYEIVLAKTIVDKDVFNEEVENLVKYFDADRVDF